MKIKSIVAGVLVLMIIAITGCGQKDNNSTGNEELILWFDYWENIDNSQRTVGSSREYTPDTISDAVFRVNGDSLSIFLVKGENSTLLYSGMPINNTYFCDINGDGVHEICSTVSFGSGMVDSRIYIYDYANNTTYTLQDRGLTDYELTVKDGQLMIMSYPAILNYSGIKENDSRKITYSEVDLSLFERGMIY